MSVDNDGDLTVSAFAERARRDLMATGEKVRKRSPDHGNGKVHTELGHNRKPGRDPAIAQNQKCAIAAEGNNRASQNREI